MIVDAHSDVLLELLVGGEGSSLELVLRRGRERLFGRWWLPRLEAGGVGVQVCPLYGACEAGEGARERALDQEAEFRGAVKEHADRVCQVRTHADLDDPRLQLVLSMEGVEPLDGDPDAFEDWYARGVRSVGLTWNHSNAFAGGIEEPTVGLSERGRTLVRRFAELGVMLDLAHASEQTWRDVLGEGAPFSVTHGCCRAIRDHPRNLDDWQLEALAGRGGVLGLMAVGYFVDPDERTPSRLLDHVDHAVAVMGIEHVGLAADFNAVSSTEQELSADGASRIEAARIKARLWLDGFTAPDDYPVLIAALRERGYEGDRLEAIESRNWLRILRQSLPG